MMSPLSVSQYLAPGVINFDIVVMDEASQLKPEDALGAILRGTQLVVVGDPMQLPPTSFFERLDGGDENEPDESSAAVADSESILDVAGMLYLPARLLKWHYRSEHGSLIAFSNAEFYDNRLTVFPSPVGQNSDLGVQFVHVATGIYQAGTNQEEARRVMDGVLRHMRLRPGESLGVVALNIRQREVLEDEFDRRLRDDVFAQRFVEGHSRSAEPFFIKNLENVQGDERDVIFISVTYGPDQARNVFQRFGPITGPHGHRRLNVLFTRAKRRVVVFSSMTSEQIVANEGRSWGIRALKRYLAYANTGTIPDTRFTGREPDSDFEIEVAQAIRALGFDSVAQLGVAGFYLDLAVKHPTRPDTFILAVECDGATYHCARVARDRDRLRQEILERLNWRVHRIWSTDWFRNRAAVIAKLKKRLEEVLREDEEIRRQTATRHGTGEAESAPASSRPGVAPRVPETAPPALESAESPITVGEAHRLLVNLRERVLTLRFPECDRRKGLLRKSMIDLLLAQRPTNLEAWVRRIPEYDRKNTDENQLTFLDDVFKIIARIAR
jgi:very-short-patch-repair endonuclease